MPAHHQSYSNDYRGHSQTPTGGHDDALYDAPPKEAATRFIHRFSDFKGHASRSEYWWVHLFLFIIWIFFGGLFNILGVSEASRSGQSIGFAGMVVVVLFIAVVFAAVLPVLALSWRRLHDAGIPALLFLLVLIPFVGPIIIMILMAMPTKTPPANMWVRN